MIKLYFEGGLGNQMFQYTYGRYAQEKFHDQVMYDISKYKYNSGEIREFELHSFNICHDWKQLDEENNALKKYDVGYVGYRLASVPYLLINRKLVANGSGTVGDKLFQRVANFFGYYRRYYGDYYDFFPSINKNKHIMGHWFRKDIVEKMDEVVRDELKVIEPMPYDVEKYLEKIRTTNSVGMHIRRGDYVKLGMIVCDIGYYQKCMQTMSNLVDDPTFFVFSDDIDWAKENLNTKYKTVFVEGEHTAAQDIKLLYSCNHFIMSNSTFSWWGAYLGSYSNKKVLTPRYWGSKKVKSEMILDSWIDVENF